MAERVDRVAGPLVLGREYLVPTVEYPWFGLVKAWPVIGPRHEDREFINFPWRHYHVDGRFLTDRHVAWVVNRRLNRQTLELICASSPLLQRDSATADYTTIPHPPVVFRLRRYHRPLAYPVRPFWLAGLEGAYCDRTLVNGRCPHRGAYIANVAPNPDGTITCPLHGLRWDAATGRPAWLPLLAAKHG